MGTKDWKEIEKLATVIEQHLDPGATVKHDVKLPDLTDATGKTKRQCDIVIETGPAHSRTRTIAEVQSRDSKPTILEFEGWLAKMRDVGAQHLLCISEKGFPASISRKAATWGPTVRLVTISAIEDGSWALAPFTSSTVDGLRYERFSGFEVKLAHGRITRTRKSLGPEERIFRVERSHVLSASDVLDFHFFSQPERLTEIPVGKLARVQVRFPAGLLEYEALDTGEWLETEYVLLTIDVVRYEAKIEWGAVDYVQDERLAWIMKGTLETSNGTVDVVAPVTEIGEGAYRVGRPQILSQTDIGLFMHFAGEKPQTIRAASFDVTFGKESRNEE